MGNKSTKQPTTSTKSSTQQVSTQPHVTLAEEKYLESVQKVSLIEKESYALISPPKSYDINNDKTIVSVLCFSDTHSLQDQIDIDLLPVVDIIIHSGDFTNVGKEKDIKQYDDWIKKLKQHGKCRQAVLIAGNHDITFHEEYYEKVGYKRFHYGNKEDCYKNKSLIKNSIYLEDSSIELFGIKIYGSPWQPNFNNWAFNLKRGNEIAKKWKLIENDCDILITHGPPFGHGDKLVSHHITIHDNDNRQFAGCKDLLKKIKKDIKPKFHIFGHIHEGYGVTKDPKLNTYFINASTVTVNYKVRNKPIMFYIKPEKKI